MKIYYAIEVGNAIHILNGDDELGGLIDNDVPHLVLGVICDDQNYGDRCDTTCLHYRKGTCPAVTIHDFNKDMWHVLMDDDTKRKFGLNKVDYYEY